MDQSVRKAYFELHLAVLLFGGTAILGDLIQLSALVLVWWRVLLTSISLAPFVRLRQLVADLGWKRLLRFAGIGVLVAIHWLCFYGAIKLANASIALICMATTSFFTSLLEPIIVRQPFRVVELLFGLMIIPGMMLVVRSTDAAMNTGLVVGLMAALLAAIFATLNKRYIKEGSPVRITFIELGAAWLFLGMLLPIYLWNGTEHFWPAPTDWGYLFVLALLCTTFAYVLSLRALEHISAFAANLTVNLEPVYGIGLAWLLLGDKEELSAEFYLGALIISAAVFGFPLYNRVVQWRVL